MSASGVSRGALKIDGVSSRSVSKAGVSESGVSRGSVKSANFRNFFYLKNS